MFSYRKCQSRSLNPSLLVPKPMLFPLKLLPFQLEYYYFLTKIMFLAIQIIKFSVQGFIFVEGVLRRSMKFLIIYVEYHLYPGGAISFFSDTRTVVRYMDPHMFFYGLIIVCIGLVFCSQFIVSGHMFHVMCHYKVAASVCIPFVPVLQRIMGVHNQRSS